GSPQPGTPRARPQWGVRVQDVRRALGAARPALCRVRDRGPRRPGSRRIFRAPSARPCRLRRNEIVRLTAARRFMASVSERPPRPWKDQWDDELAWTGTSSPEGDGPHAIHAAIVRDGLTRFGDVASSVANALFTRDSSHAGFIASIGFFRT